MRTRQLYPHLSNPQYQSFQPSHQPAPSTRISFPQSRAIYLAFVPLRSWHLNQSWPNTQFLNLSLSLPSRLFKKLPHCLLLLHRFLRLLLPNRSYQVVHSGNSRFPSSLLYLLQQLQNPWYSLPALFKAFPPPQYTMELTPLPHLEHRKPSSNLRPLPEVLTLHVRTSPPLSCRSVKFA